MNPATSLIHEPSPVKGMSRMGIWTIRCATMTCDKCGRVIPAGQRFLWFRWFAGRRFSVACNLCGEGDRDASE